MSYGVNASGFEMSYVRVAIADTVEPVSSPTLSVVVPIGISISVPLAALRLCAVGSVPSVV